MFIIMFTFVVFSHQLTLPFPHSWNTDVNLDRELFGLIPRYIAWRNAAYSNPRPQLPLDIQNLTIQSSVLFTYTTLVHTTCVRILLRFFKNIN